MADHADAQAQDEAAQRERYQELLAELRTIIPGVQVLFAFLADRALQRPLPPSRSARA